MLVFENDDETEREGAVRTGGAAVQGAEFVRVGEVELVGEL